MVNKLWVRWTDGVRSTKVVVKDQEHPPNVDDLCKIFVVDRKWPTLDPASLQVYDKEGDGRTELTSSTKLKDFFVDSSESASNNGPGQSEKTALFITQPLYQDGRKRKFLEQHGRGDELEQMLIQQNEKDTKLQQMLNQQQTLIRQLALQQTLIQQLQQMLNEKDTKLQQTLIQQNEKDNRQLALLKLLSEEVNKNRKSRLNCWERESQRTTGIKRDPDFREKVISHYKRESNSGKSVKCQILDEYVLHDIARDTIIAVHIWKAETQGKHLDEFGLREEDVNNVRNGMFLTKGIKDAFDKQQVCFLYNKLSNEPYLWVADTTILSDTIEGSNPPTTFADVRKKPLRCPDKDHMPFRRLLAWHARLTLELRKESIQATSFTSEYDLAPGRAGATLDLIAQAIDDMVESGEDASVSD